MEEWRSGGVEEWRSGQPAREPVRPAASPNEVRSSPEADERREDERIRAFYWSM